MTVELMGLQVLALGPMEQIFLPKREFCEGFLLACLGRYFLGLGSDISQLC